MSASSPNTVVGDTASTVMGLSPQAASIVQRLDSSIIDSLQQAIERHTGDNGRFLRIADRHLSHFKGLLLARSDNQPGSPPNFPSSTVPSADPNDNNSVPNCHSRNSKISNTRSADYQASSFVDLLRVAKAHFPLYCAKAISRRRV